MLSTADRLRTAAADDSGFTLVETLVATVTGLVLGLVVLTMLQVTTEQTRRLSDKVQANRSARQTMTDIADELHSACFMSEFAPVQAGSSPTELIFFNAYSEGAEIKSAAESAKEGVYEHAIKYYKATETVNGHTRPAKTLWDKIFPTSSVAALPGTPTVETAVSKTKEVELGAYLEPVEAGGTSEWVFKYWKYKEQLPTQVEATSSSPTLEEIKLGPHQTLKEREAETKAALPVAAVQIGFEQRPADREQKLSVTEEKRRGVLLESQVTLSLGSPAVESKLKDEPCY
jgi:type II secretory pathway pseudopilin PulG